MVIRETARGTSPLPLPTEAALVGRHLLLQQSCPRRQADVLGLGFIVLFRTHSDIFCAVRTVEQAEQPSLAEDWTGLVTGTFFAPAESFPRRQATALFSWVPGKKMSREGSPGGVAKQARPAFECTPGFQGSCTWFLDV
eukprot:1152690-Pelagomonas_calceolata.AAC.1